MVFSRFEVLGSIRQTHRWFHDERIELPENKPVRGRFELRWQLPTMSFLKDVLTNPLYAGAYVYGRRPVKVSVRDGQTIRRQRSVQQPENAGVFIAEHHEAHIDWDSFQRHRNTMLLWQPPCQVDDYVELLRGINFDHDLVAKELDTLKASAAAMTPADELTLRELGRHFAEVWNSDACPMPLKKRIAGTLIVRRRRGDVVLAPHGSHARLRPAIALAGAPAELAQHARDLVIAIARGHALDEFDVFDPDTLNLAQAQKHTGVSDTTLMRLIRANLLPVQQIAPYAPLEIKRVDLDTEPVASIIRHLKRTGRLVLHRDPSAEQVHLF